jgi:hypothetical protein
LVQDLVDESDGGRLLWYMPAGCCVDLRNPPAALLPCLVEDLVDESDGEEHESADSVHESTRRERNHPDFRRRRVEEHNGGVEEHSGGSTRGGVGASVRLAASRPGVRCGCGSPRCAVRVN